MNSKIILKTIATEGLFFAAMGVCGTLDLARISLVGIGKGAGIAKKLAAKTESVANSGSDSLRSMEIKVLDGTNAMVDSIQKWGDEPKAPLIYDAINIDNM